MTGVLPDAALAAATKPQARGKKSSGKRDAIIRAAIEVINAKSFALATMAEIAASLELRDATLYYYFSSKQALAYACHVRSLERFERLLAAGESLELDGLGKMRHLMRALIDEWNTNGSQLYFGDYSYLDDAQRETIAASAGALRARLQMFIEQGMADGSIQPCEAAVVVQLLLGMIIWLAKWTSDIDGLTAERLMRGIEAFAFHGLERRS